MFTGQHQSIRGIGGYSVLKEMFPRNGHPLFNGKYRGYATSALQSFRGNFSWIDFDCVHPKGTRKDFLLPCCNLMRLFWPDAAPHIISQRTRMNSRRASACRQEILWVKYPSKILQFWKKCAKLPHKQDGCWHEIKAYYRILSTLLVILNPLTSLMKWRHFRGCNHLCIFNNEQLTIDSILEWRGCWNANHLHITFMPLTVPWWLISMKDTTHRNAAL